MVASVRRFAASDTEAAAAAVLEDGVAVLEHVMPAELCAALIPPILAHPEKAAQPIGFYHAPAMFNIDSRYMQLAAHPALVDIAHRVIGGRTEPLLNASAVPLANQLRMNDANGVVAEPGNRNGFWHCDGPTGQLHPDRIPDFATTLTMIWMLTEFSERTGATRVVPKSHKLRRLPPVDLQGPGISLDGSSGADDVPLLGTPGCVAIIGNTTWHTLGLNSSSEPRVGLQCTLYPWFFGRSGGIQRPVSRGVWATLEPIAQELTKHMLEWGDAPVRDSLAPGDERAGMGPGFDASAQQQTPRL